MWRHSGAPSVDVWSECAQNVPQRYQQWRQIERVRVHHQEVKQRTPDVTYRRCLPCMLRWISNDFLPNCCRYCFLKLQFNDVKYSIESRTPTPCAEFERWFYCEEHLIVKGLSRKWRGATVSSTNRWNAAAAGRTPNRASQCETRWAPSGLGWVLIRSRRHLRRPPALSCSQRRKSP